MTINTPQSFLDYIKNSKFDYSSLRVHEVETLSGYLRLTAEDQEKLIAWIRNKEEHEILNKNTLVKIGRNRSEQDSGEIDIEVSVSRVEELSEDDFEKLIATLESAKFGCINARKDLKDGSRAKKIVATWPKWKRELADQVLRPSKKP